MNIYEFLLILVLGLAFIIGFFHAVSQSNKQKRPFLTVKMKDGIVYKTYEVNYNYDPKSNITTIKFQIEDGYKTIIEPCNLIDKIIS